MSEPTLPKKTSSYLVMLAVVVVVGIGLAAMIGSPEIRDRAKDKSVLNNLEMIQAGADQYFMEHPGVTSVASVTIVGTNSTQYIRSWASVAQETYTPLIVQGQAIRAMGVAGTRTVTFGP